MARGRRTLIGIVLIRQFNLAKQGGGCQGSEILVEGNNEWLVYYLHSGYGETDENHGVGPTEKKMGSVSCKTRNPNEKLLVLRSHIER